MTPCANGLLRSVVSAHRLVGVATDDPPPTGGRRATRYLRAGWQRLRADRPLADWAAGRGLPCFHYHAGDAQGFAAWLRRLDADLLITCKAPLLPETVFDAPRLGAINIHYSLLPNYRGGSPLLWQVVHAESEGGVTIHRIDAGIDTGPLLVQRAVPLPAGASSRELDRLLAGVAAQLLPEAIDKVARGERGRPPPPMPGAVFAPNPGHPSLLAFIDWRRWPLERIWRVLRFMEYWPVTQGVPAGWRRLLRWRVGGIVSSRPGPDDWRLRPAGLRLRLETRRGEIELIPRLHLPTLVRAPGLLVAHLHRLE